MHRGRFSIVLHARSSIKSDLGLKAVKTPKIHVLGSKLAFILCQIGRKISDLYSGMHLYTKQPDFFEVKKAHFGLTFGE